MGYCFMSTEKVKTLGALKSKYNHNYRQVTVENADPERIGENEELLPIDEHGNQKSYVDFFHERIAGLDYYKDHNIRKNQNCAIEVVTTFSREDTIDIEAWKKKNVEWLKETFNKAGDGKNNIASVVFHADEPGNVHCHAMVIPIDDKGHLNARYYTNGFAKLTEMQNTYAESMKEFGLQRGVAGAQMKHKQLRKFYADLNRAMVLPDVNPFETAEEFRTRCIEELETMRAADYRRREKAEREFQRSLAKERIEQRSAIANEYKVQVHELEEKNAYLKNLIQANEARKRELEQELSELKIKSRELEELTGRSPDEIREQLDIVERLKKRLVEIEEDDPEKAEIFKEIMFQKDKEIERWTEISR